MKTKGILLFAHNNREIDYVTQALVSGKFAQKYLNVPVSLVTNTGSLDYFKSIRPDQEQFFDQIIFTDDLPQPVYQTKRYYDGSLNYKNRSFNNGYRSMSYELSPYDKTLVMDTDLLIVNDKLKSIWEIDTDFMINKKHFDVSNDRDDYEFVRVNDHSIDFYWATIFYFEKTPWTKIFFNLCQHIVENYDFYKFTYQINSPLIRNDYVFSIAIHILGGFNNKIKPMPLPCEFYYTLDRDILILVHNEKDFLFLIEKKEYLGQYSAARISNHNIHIMNKYSFNRHADKLLEVIENV